MRWVVNVDAGLISFLELYGKNKTPLSSFLGHDNISIERFFPVDHLVAI
jgi:hypothetical protein